MPIISVIVPVYKVEPYIRRCIDSILSQTFTDFELILVDDGSPDNCPVICDEYALIDSRIHVIHQKNGGLSAARNAGLDYVFSSSTSNWISFVDSDDWVHVQYLELLYVAVSKYNANISQCTTYRVNKNHNLPNVYNDIIKVSPDNQYLSFYHPNACGKLYQKNCFSNLRFPEGQLYEDVAIWYKLLFAQESIVVVNEPLYYYFYREDSIVNKDWTPKQLDQVKAWRSQVAFLKNYHNINVYKEAIYRYVYVLTDHIQKIENSKSINSFDKKMYSFKLRFLLGKALNENKVFLCENKNYDWYYEMAHPKLSWYYWTVKGIFNRFKREKNE